MLLTRAPVAGSREQALYPAAPRLACVKPVASVHPEPGSNSPLLVIFFQISSCLLSVDRPRLRLRARAEASLLRRIDKELPSTALSRSLALLLVYCKLFNVLMLPAPLPGR